MSRKKDKTKAPRVSSGARSLNARNRRAQRVASSPEAYDFSWLVNVTARMAAAKILNGEKVYPYWLSRLHEPSSSGDPIAGFYPVMTFKFKDRIYYGFVFREHREAVFEKWDPDARREFIDRIDQLQSRKTR